MLVWSRASLDPSLLFLVLLSLIAAVLTGMYAVLVSLDEDGVTVRVPSVSGTAKTIDTSPMSVDGADPNDPLVTSTRLHLLHLRGRHRGQATTANARSAVHLRVRPAPPQADAGHQS